jgi:two-component system chemotaxis response regulator CheB
VEQDRHGHDGDVRRDLVVIGASAGGVDTLRRVVAGLPANLAATVCIVVHIAPSSPSALARILHRAGPLKCSQASDGDPLRVGEILVAPPDRHLVVEDDHVHLTVGPRENGHRPAVDALFRSAAGRGGKVIGVVLSGNRDDGTAGLAAIKESGGAAIVQDPEEALYAGMPASALANVTVDAVVPSERIAEVIAAMVRSDDPYPPARQDDPAQPAAPEGEISICPECGGVLSEEHQSGVPQWSCRVGHRYSAESLAEEQAKSVEAALWAGVRALQDRGRLLERLAAQAEAKGQRRSARNFRIKARDAQAQADVVLGALSEAAAGTLRHLDEGAAEAEPREASA